ncbi:MAG: molybdate ABC transporter permease subunit [Solibacterales bacterium]|nr:molybdate ABC transporter permease subunit [Bryobacterales bacterium]|tara:strand:+ start:3689 stop:4366 length:678 start_codon:yes stop_codon:yes gene_type:complete
MNAIESIDWFPFWLSLRVAFLATIIAVVLGLGVAYLLVHTRFRGRNLIETACTLPIVLPPTVLGYYLLVLLGRSSPIGQIYEQVFDSPLVFTWQAAVIAACIHATPLLVRAGRAAFQSVDHTLENVARSLGASEWRVFWRVTLPLAKRSIAAAAVFSFARSLGDFGATIMIAGNIPGQTQTMSVAIYDAYQSGNTMVANVLVIILSLMALLVLFLINRATERKDF